MSPSSLEPARAFMMVCCIFFCAGVISGTAEPVGAGNGGLAGSFVSVVFSIVMGYRAAPDLFVRPNGH